MGRHRPGQKLRLVPPLDGFQPAELHLEGERSGLVSVLMTRKPSWELVLPGPVDQDMSLAEGGDIYVVDRSGRLHRIDARQGTLRWTFESGDPSGLLFTPVHRRHAASM